MKRVRLLAAFIFFFIAGSALAEETATVELKIPQNVGKQACPNPIWENLNIFWKGSIDKRASKALGVQTKKGQEPINVLPKEPLTQTFDSGMRELLTACGAKLANKQREEMIVLSAEITDFSVGVEKKIVTGKASANSSVFFMTQNGPTTKTMTMSFNADSKGTRQGKIKQLEKEINLLLTDTLVKLPSSKEFMELFQ